MLKTKNKEPTNLDAMTGFHLVILDCEGRTMDEVGLYAQSHDGYDDIQLRILSFAKSLVYMFRFYYGKWRDKTTCKMHLRDLERKLVSFNKEIK